jgi:enamine deaminase RidA (YjgF/YER057c/UK114 family)
MISDAYYIDRQVYAVESPYSAFNVPPAYDSKLYRGISTTSLQLPINPADNSTMTEILGQTLLAMQNLQLVVTASGGFMKNILKCTIVLHVNISLSRILHCLSKWQQFISFTLKKKADRQSLSYHLICPRLAIFKR